MKEKVGLMNLNDLHVQSHGGGGQGWCGTLLSRLEILTVFLRQDFIKVSSQNIDSSGTHIFQKASKNCLNEVLLPFCPHPLKKDVKLRPHYAAWQNAALHGKRCSAYTAKLMKFILRNFFC